MKKLAVLSLFMLVSACNMTNNLFANYSVENTKVHLFSDDLDFIHANAKCEHSYITDEYNSSDNEIYRCSGDLSSLFIEIESDGNNSEKIKKAKLLWKNWDHVHIFGDPGSADVKRFVAIFARLYAADKEKAFLKSFMEKSEAKFNAENYEIVTSIEKRHFYKLHKAELIFN